MQFMRICTYDRINRISEFFINADIRINRAAYSMRFLNADYALINAHTLKRNALMKKICTANCNFDPSLRI